MKKTKKVTVSMTEETKQEALSGSVVVLGTESIAIACSQMKQKLIGYEFDTEYYEKACKRFKEQTAQ